MLISETVSRKFRQIDFLRLFRLCRDMGLVNRKRKMPIEYLRDGECKNACKRLLKEVLQEVYKEHQIHVGYNSATAHIPNELQRQYQQMMRDVFYNDYYTPYGGHPVRQRVVLPAPAMELLNSFYNFTGFGNRHVTLSFPNYIMFNYRMYDRNQRDRDQKESFYRCALDCIGFKKHWDDSMAIIIDAYQKALADIQNVDKDRQELEKKAAERGQQRQSEAQRLFNEALANLRNTNRET